MMSEIEFIYDCERSKIRSRKQSFGLKEVPVVPIVQSQTGKVRIRYAEDFCNITQSVILKNQSIQLVTS